MLAAIAIAGCAITGDTGRAAAFDAKSLAGTRWVLDQQPPAKVEAGRPVPPAPTLQFTDPARVNGTGGCNGFTGKAAIDGDTVRLGPLAATRRMCPQPMMQVEDSYFRQLDAVRRARMDGSALVLLDDTGKALLRLLPAK
jgi:heat shock protein HslJ